MKKKKKMVIFGKKKIQKFDIMGNLSVQNMYRNFNELMHVDSISLMYLFFGYVRVV